MRSDKKTPQKQDKLLQHIQSISEKPKKLDNTRYYQRDDDTKNFLTKDLLSKGPFRDFTFEFTPEERVNIESLELTETLENSVIFDIENYSFEYHMLFLSHLPEEPVFVWKMVYIWKMPNHKEPGSSHKEAEWGILSSLTVFAKINVLLDEKLIETKFLGSNWVYTKTTQGPNQLSVRVYSTDGYLRVRPEFINTMHTHSVSAISSAVVEIDIQNVKSPQGSSSYFRVTVWNSTRDIASNKICEGAHYTTHVFRGFDNLVILVDADNGTVVAYKDYNVTTLDCKMKKIKSIYQVEKSLFMKSEDDIDYELTWDESAEILLKKTTSSEEICKTIGKIYQNLARKKRVIESFSSPTNLLYSTHFTLVHRYPLLVKDLEFTAGSKTKRDQGENKQFNRVKKKRNLVEEIKKIQKEHRSGNNQGETVEMKKEILKQIRKDISTKMTEISKFDEEYKTEQKEMGTEELKEPEGVSKEMLDLYAKIKAEKKSLYREKNKKKKQIKQNRSEY